MLQVCIASIHRYLVDTVAAYLDITVRVPIGHRPTPTPNQEVYWVYTPSVLGSAGFVFASYVYVVEVTHDHSNLRTHPNPNPYPDPNP
tara:strand:- start:53 stop:316 length:264 start_codon:yes stop_codon:yes gene_type:complete